MRQGLPAQARRGRRHAGVAQRRDAAIQEFGYLSVRRSAGVDAISAHAALVVAARLGSYRLRRFFADPRRSLPAIMREQRPRSAAGEFNDLRTCAPTRSSKAPLPEWPRPPAPSRATSAATTTASSRATGQRHRAAQSGHASVELHRSQRAGAAARGARQEPALGERVYAADPAHVLRQDIRLLNSVMAPVAPARTPNVYEFRNYRTQAGRARGSGPT